MQTTSLTFQLPTDSWDGGSNADIEKFQHTHEKDCFLSNSFLKLCATRSYGAPQWPFSTMCFVDTEGKDTCTDFSSTIEHISSATPDIQTFTARVYSVGGKYQPSESVLFSDMWKAFDKFCMQGQKSNGKLQNVFLFFHNRKHDLGVLEHTLRPSRLISQAIEYQAHSPSVVSPFYFKPDAGASYVSSSTWKSYNNSSQYVAVDTLALVNDELDLRTEEKAPPSFRSVSALYHFLFSKELSLKAERRASKLKGISNTEVSGQVAHEADWDALALRAIVWFLLKWATTDSVSGKSLVEAKQAILQLVSDNSLVFDKKMWACLEMFYNFRGTQSARPIELTRHFDSEKSTADTFLSLPLYAPVNDGVGSVVPDTLFLSPWMDALKRNTTDGKEDLGSSLAQKFASVSRFKSEQRPVLHAIGCSHLAKLKAYVSDVPQIDSSQKRIWFRTGKDERSFVAFSLWELLNFRIDAESEWIRKQVSSSQSPVSIQMLLSSRSPYRLTEMLGSGNPDSIPFILRRRFPIDRFDISSTTHASDGAVYLVQRRDGVATRDSSQWFDSQGRPVHGRPTDENKGMREKWEQRLSDQWNRAHTLSGYVLCVQAEEMALQLPVNILTDPEKMKRFRPAQQERGQWDDWLKNPILFPTQKLWLDYDTTDLASLLTARNNLLQEIQFATKTNLSNPVTQVPSSSALPTTRESLSLSVDSLERQMQSLALGDEKSAVVSSSGAGQATPYSLFESLLKNPALLHDRIKVQLNSSVYSELLTDDLIQHIVKPRKKNSFLRLLDEFPCYYSKTTASKQSNSKEPFILQYPPAGSNNRFDSFRAILFASPTRPVMIAGNGKHYSTKATEQYVVWTAEVAKRYRDTYGLKSVSLTEINHMATLAEIELNDSTTTTEWWKTDLRLWPLEKLVLLSVFYPGLVF